MERKNELLEFLRSLERKELNDEQQMLLLSGGIEITITGNNFLAGCPTNNCKGGNCGNCVAGCGVKS
ncbi:hypothetical protein [Phocaeicola coprophilus]|uniref:hypothetical protein n=1 Tax=Phocaeicola coprophilus TaxID=387090 RepID=UPI001D5AE0F8|nr:hypothetical protein [Phocaeicola coprophilus]HJE48374.1 hypothetical protein [Phocaeicola coprophilus]